MSKVRYVGIANDNLDELNGEDLESIRKEIEEIFEDYGLSGIKVTAEDAECIRKNDKKKGIRIDTGIIEDTISFFENPCDNGWDKDELLADYVSEVLKEAKSELFYGDELAINDGERDVMVLSDFADELYEKIIAGVCNVLKTAEK